MELYIHSSNILKNDKLRMLDSSLDGVSVNSMGEDEVNIKSSKNKFINVEKISYDLALEFGKKNIIDTIDVSDESKVSYRGSGSEFELTDFNKCWSAILYLNNIYDNHRGQFYDKYKDIRKIVVVEDKESSYKICEDSDGDKWLVFRVARSGAACINEGVFLDFIAKEVYKEMSTLPDEIKLVKIVDGIDLTELRTTDNEGLIIAYDSSLNKYFASAFRELVSRISLDLDIKYGLTKQYTIKHKGEV